jgi:hypothetical protein
MARHIQLVMKYKVLLRVVFFTYHWAYHWVEGYRSSIALVYWVDNLDDQRYWDRNPTEISLYHSLSQNPKNKLKIA